MRPYPLEAHHALTRRGFLIGVPAAGAAATLLPGHGLGIARAEDAPHSASALPHPEFPQVDPKLAQEMVGVCHVNEARVKELVQLKPELVNAVWDWGFGDYETALGAASHTGRRGIAEFLLQNGARLDIFAATMLGMTDVVKAMVTALPGVQKTPGPHGITLLSHARAGGEAAREVMAWLESLGDADQRPGDAALSADEQEIYLGKYPFGPAAEDRILVKRNDRGDMQLAVGKGSSRNLFRLGPHEFYPAGAASVRIRFDVENDKAQALTIVDNQITFSARRKGA